MHRLVQVDSRRYRRGIALLALQSNSDFSDQQRPTVCHKSLGVVHQNFPQLWSSRYLAGDSPNPIIPLFCQDLGDPNSERPLVRNPVLHVSDLRHHLEDKPTIIGRTPPLTPLPTPVLSYIPRTHVREASGTGERVQKVQVGCRNDFAKVHPVPKLDRFLLSFGGCRRCGRCKNQKTFFVAPNSFRLSTNLPVNLTTVPSPFMEECPLPAGTGAPPG